jgi:hypothetical protein
MTDIRRVTIEDELDVLIKKKEDEVNKKVDMNNGRDDRKRRLEIKIWRDKTS